MDKIAIDSNQITVTKRDIEGAMTVNRLEVNLFALSKMKTQFTRQRSRVNTRKSNFSLMDNGMGLFKSNSKIKKPVKSVDVKDKSKTMSKIPKIGNKISPKPAEEDDEEF